MAAGDRARRTDAAVRLANGRQLGFAEWGDPAGVPVVVFHPTPGSRRLGISTDAVAYELGVRLICLERPGFGLSEYQPRRSVLDWPSDVAEFADVLGLGSFAVAGLAGGGPYALACGRRLPDRLTGVGVVAGQAPPDLYDDDRLMVLVRHDPDRARRVIHERAVALAAGLDSAVVELAERPGPDGQVYGRPEVREMLVTTGREALRAGIDGMVTDVWLQCNPWGFRLSGVAARVHWWHGDADDQTPVAVARRAVRHLPRATLSVLPGKGHAVAFDHGDEILAAMAGWA